MDEAQGGKAPASETSNIGGQTPGLAVAVAAGCLIVIVVYDFGRSKFCQDENCEQ